eukprot:Awhi_evm2s10392
MGGQYTECNIRSMSLQADHNEQQRQVQLEQQLVGDINPQHLVHHANEIPALRDPILYPQQPGLNVPLYVGPLAAVPPEDGTDSSDSVSTPELTPTNTPINPRPRHHS